MISRLGAWVRRHLAAIAIAALAALSALWCLLPAPAGWVESHYSTGLFPFLAAALVPLSDACPFPLGPVAAMALLAALAALGFRGWRRARARGERRWWILGQGGLWALGLAIAAAALGLILWGANYQRLPLEKRLGLEGAAQVSPAEVEAYARQLAEWVTEDATALAAEPGNAEPAFAALRASLGDLLARWHGLRPTLPRRWKSLPAGTLMAFGSSGMTWPYTLEALVDSGLPECSALAVATHEIAHVAGIAAEGDADFAAAAAGLACAETYGRYCLELSLLQSFLRELPKAQRREIEDRLPERARRDLEAQRQAWQRHYRPAFAAIQRRIFDAHLRLQGLRDGVRDYSRALGRIVEASRKALVARHVPTAPAEASARR